MPTYQYACTVCGHAFEQVQSFHDDPVAHCPECDGRVRKVFNAVGVVFKGSGFYRTDNRSGSDKAKSKPAGSSDSGSSSTGSSDSGSSKSSESGASKSDAKSSGSGSSSSPASSSSGSSSSGTSQ